MDAAEIIDLLALKPHPEGGHFRETFRDSLLSSFAGAPGADGLGQRAASTAIYFLLQRGERSHWHRVDAAEVWHHYAGAPLLLEIADDNEGPIRQVRLGVELSAGERPQAVVPAGAWQAAACLGDWTLVGCTVAPGFEFAGFEMAAKGWRRGA
jgi:uncharacterized protein